MVQSACAETASSVITCRVHPSGFERADSNFYSLNIASDLCVYYTLSSHNIDTHARVYRYDPARDEVKLMFDIGEAVGEAGLKTLPQGKSHSPFFELDGWLYLATHYGFFASTEQREHPAPVPEGYKPYPGGHLIRFNMTTGETEDLAVAPPEEGIITLNMDAQRGRCCGLTWPKGFFLVYDLETRKLRNLGPVSRGGEVGSGDQYFCLVRSFAVDPRDGHVYFTNSDGEVLCYEPGADRVAPFGDLRMDRDIFGAWDPHRPGHQGYNWRDILWHEESQCFYGVHPKSGWLFRFDPPARRIDLIARITADELLRSGRFEPFRYGYLTLQVGPDRRTLYYLTSTYGVRTEEGPDLNQKIHLVTYNLETGRYADHGVLQLEDGRYPRMSQCHAVHPNGRGYTCPWMPGLLTEEERQAAEAEARERAEQRARREAAEGGRHGEGGAHGEHRAEGEGRGHGEGRGQGEGRRRRWPRHECQLISYPDPLAKKA
jgi:hypothetical protein